MSTPLTHHWLDRLSLFWLQLLRRDRAEAGPIYLDRRRVYVLPTRAGVLFTFVLLTMLIGAINYNNSLAYALTFLLASMSIVSILHTFRNLHGLTFHAGHPSEVFAGNSVHVPLAMENHHGERFAVTVQFDHGEWVVADIGKGELHRIDLHFPSQRRGWLPLPRITVSTLYPLGLFRAWSYLHFDVRALVYPSPAIAQPLPIANEEGGTTGGSFGRGSDDFVQLRPYHPGDSLHHVHWKAYAREMGLLVKQFGATRSPELWFSWYASNERDSEARLSQLCRWILDAEAAGLAYGLIMPTHRVEPACGEAHRRHCLEILALHGSESPS